MGFQKVLFLLGKSENLEGNIFVETIPQLDPVPL